jgi:hypothetical protein
MVFKKNCTKIITYSNQNQIHYVPEPAEKDNFLQNPEKFPLWLDFQKNSYNIFFLE